VSHAGSSEQCEKSLFALNKSPDTSKNEEVSEKKPAAQ
jgi:hypothetical protein